MLYPEFHTDPRVEEEYDSDDDLMEFEVNLDIPGFVRDAVRQNLKRPEILIYLHLVASTYEATDKMRRFFPVAQENNLSRNEILIWLHLAYGGSRDPRHISRKLRIPRGWVEKSLTVLDEKNIVIQDAVQVHP